MAHFVANPYDWTLCHYGTLILVGAYNVGVQYSVCWISLSLVRSISIVLMMVEKTVISAGDERIHTCIPAYLTPHYIESR